LFCPHFDLVLFYFIRSARCFRERIDIEDEFCTSELQKSKIHCHTYQQTLSFLRRESKRLLARLFFFPLVSFACQKNKCTMVIDLFSVQEKNRQTIIHASATLPADVTNVSIVSLKLMS